MQHFPFIVRETHCGPAVAVVQSTNIFVVVVSGSESLPQASQAFFCVLFLLDSKPETSVKKLTPVQLLGSPRLVAAANHVSWRSDTDVNAGSYGLTQKLPVMLIT